MKVHKKTTEMNQDQGQVDTKKEPHIRETIEIIMTRRIRKTTTQKKDLTEKEEEVMEELKELEDLATEEGKPERTARGFQAWGNLS